MGRAADREFNRKVRFLSRLAKENPERFSDEWDVRLQGWLKEITCSRKGYIDSERVFSIAEKAVRLLKACGGTAMRMEFERTHDVLSTACTKAVARQFGNELYRLTSSVWAREQGGTID